MRYLLVLTTGIFLLLIVVAWFLRTQQEQSKAVTLPVSEQLQPSPVISPTGVQSEANIIVSEPREFEEVDSPFLVKGKARVFENRFSYRLLTEDGVILEEGSADADAPDVGQFGDFSITLSYPALSVSQSGRLEVFSYSPKDGEEMNTVVIPLFFMRGGFR